MSWIPPLLVVMPMLGAAAIAGGDHLAPQLLEKAVALAVAAATLVLALLLTLHTGGSEPVHWFGGWRPRHGLALGIDFAVDPLAAAMCTVIAAVVLLALVYSWTYLRNSARLFEALMLIALAGMCGFAMSGDLFNMFVWLELAGVAGYALTGFKVEQLGPIQGAVNFAIVTSIGSYLFAIGIGLLYARTGALNLAQIGTSLGHRRDGLVIVALTLVMSAFLTKAAAVPFHLWAADAYAVAPAPVCAMFGAVMTDMGLIGVARVWWTVFDAPFAAHARAFGDLLLAVGVATALLGGVMALLQRHLKRLLAYSVVSHIGAMLAGIALLGSKGLAGTAATFVSHAFLTAALFLVAGILLTDRGTIDELALRKRFERTPGTAAIWFACALGLAGTPFVGTYLGHALIDENAAAAGRGFAVPLLWLAAAITAAAILRAGARAFLGVGATRSPLLGPELEEEPAERHVNRPVLVATAATAAAIGLAISVVPGLSRHAEAAADRFRDRAEYAGHVLRGTPVRPLGRLRTTVDATTMESLAYGAAATALACALAAAALGRRRSVERLLAPPVATLKALHSGVVGDYVVWLVVGTAVFGGVWALALR